MRTRVWGTVLIAVAVAATGCASGQDRVPFPTASAPLQTTASPPASTSATDATRSTPTTTAPTPATPATETIATGLPVPWGLAFLPDGTALVTVRDQGEVLHITEGAKPVSVGHPPGVGPGGEGGLLGIAISPAFASDRTVFVYLTSRGDNRVMRMTFDGIALTPGPVIVEGIAHRSGFVDPIRQWPTADASPSGIAMGADGAIYMAALRGESLWRIPLDGNGNAGTPKRLLQGKFGRLRTVVSAPDGRLWLVTSNTFRGTLHPGDDRILALRLPVQ